MFTKSKPSGEGTIFIEGDVLQESGSSHSAFGIVLLDLTAKKWRLETHTWNESAGRYIRPHETDWVSLEQFAMYRRAEFANTKEYAQYLEEPGASFSHPQAGQLRISDIFVYPDFEERGFGRDRARGRQPALRGSEFLDYVTDNKRVLVFGPDSSGKTTLAKVLYLEFQRKNFVPVLVRGDQIKESDAERVFKIVEKQFVEQYGGRFSEDYRQLEKTKRVLIVDDYHNLGVSRARRDGFLASAESLFDVVLLIGSDLLPLEKRSRVVRTERVGF